MKNYKKKYLARLENKTTEVQEKEPFYGRRCLYCYEPLFDPTSDFHEACNKRFFGQLKTPQLGYNLNNLQELATQVIQSQMAVTGVQAKVSLSLYRKQDKNLTKNFTLICIFGDFLLKPPKQHYSPLSQL